MKNQINNTSNIYNDVVDIRFIFRVWIRWIWILIPLILIGLFFGYRDLKRYEPQFEAKIIIKGEEASGPAMGGAQISQLLLDQQIVFSNNYLNNTSNIGKLKLIMKSPTLAKRLQDKYNLLPEIFSTSWDKNSGNWKVPSGKKFERSESRKAFFKQVPWSAPSIESLVAYISGSIKFVETPLGFIEVIFTHKEKEKAKNYLELIYFEADSLIRENEFKYVNEREKYLSQKLNTERKIDQRQILLTLLKEEQNKLMLLDSSEPYAAKIIEPIYVPNIPTSPNIRIMFGLPVIISIFFGFAILTLYAIFISESPKRR